MTTNFSGVARAAALSLLIASAAARGAGHDLKGSRDPPLISRYPGSVIIGYQAPQHGQLVLPTGKQEGAGKQLKLASEEQLEGTISRVLYQVPRDRSALAVWKNYLAAVEKAGLTTLFSCVGDDECGRLFHHAVKLGERELVRTALSTSPQLHYLVAKLTRPEGDVYVALYIGQHGRIRVDLGDSPMVLLELVEAKAIEIGKVTINVEALGRDLDQAGHVAVYAFFFASDSAELQAESEPALKEVASLLKAREGLRLFVIGHTDNAGRLDHNLDLSRRRARAVTEALTRRYGIAPVRLLPDGVGPYSPIAGNRTVEGRSRNRRVELVVQ